jgi:hypothetical protein
MHYWFPHYPHTYQFPSALLPGGASLPAFVHSNDSLMHFYLLSADKVTHPPHSKSRDEQTASVCLVIPCSMCDSCFSALTVFQAHSDKSSAKVSATESKPPAEPVAPAVPLFVPPPGSYMSAAAVAAINAQAVAAAASAPPAGSFSFFRYFLRINTDQSQQRPSR